MRYSYVRGSFCDFVHSSAKSDLQETGKEGVFKFGGAIATRFGIH